MKRLDEKITEYFDRSELTELCFSLNINYDELGNRRSLMALELVQYCLRRGYLDLLIEKLQTYRPDVGWSQYIVPTKNGAKLAHLQEMFSKANRLMLLGQQSQIREATMLYRQIHEVDPYFHPSLEELLSRSKALAMMGLVPKPVVKSRNLSRIQEIIKKINNQNAG
jgi:hypothetical protein